MLRATTRLAALHCSTRKQQVWSAAQAHVGVECLHARRCHRGSPVEGTARIHGYTDVRPCAACRSFAGDIYLSADLYCKTDRMLAMELERFVHNRATPTKKPIIYSLNQSHHILRMPRQWEIPIYNACTR